MITDTHKEQAREIVAELQEHLREAYDVISVGAKNWLTQRIASALASRDTEVREVLEGLSNVLTFETGPSERCWCPQRLWMHTPACLAARKLYEKVSK